MFVPTNFLTICISRCFFYERGCSRIGARITLVGDAMICGAGWARKQNTRWGTSLPELAKIKHLVYSGCRALNACKRPVHTGATCSNLYRVGQSSATSSDTRTGVPTKLSANGRPLACPLMCPLTCPLMCPLIVPTNLGLAGTPAPKGTPTN